MRMIVKAITAGVRIPVDSSIRADDTRINTCHIDVVLMESESIRTFGVMLQIPFLDGYYKIEGKNVIRELKTMLRKHSMDIFLNECLNDPIVELCLLVLLQISSTDRL
jgi:hypothetical protein